MRLLSIPLCRKNKMKEILQKYKAKLVLQGEKTLKSAWENARAVKVLSPISAVYAKVAEVKAKVVIPYDADIPVICAGNLTLGGAGKTPLAIWLAEHFKAEGMRPFFLTRGYKGKEKGLFFPDTGAQKEGGGGEESMARKIGDEPSLLLRSAPVVVDTDRARGAETAQKNGADIIIMDDGFQNHGLSKSKSLLVFDGRVGIGNGKVFPAGPLREDFVLGLKRAKAAVVVGDDTSGITIKIKSEAPDMPIFRARLIPDESVAKSLKGKKVLAFSGIGYPSKFFDTLRGIGAEVFKQKAFPDHHFYNSEDVAALENMAKEEALVMVTTQKDAVKLAPEFLGKVVVLPVKMAFENEKDFISFIGLS